MHNSILITSATESFLEYAKVVFASAVVNGGWYGDMLLLTHNVKQDCPQLKWFSEHGISIKESDTDVHPKIARYQIFGEKYKKWDHILYMDADIYVAHDLDGLSEYSYGLWAVFDAGTPTMSKYGFDDQSRVLNVGVLWFSTDQNSDQKYLEIKSLTENLNRTMPHLKGRDQHIINSYFKGQWNELPIEYNVLLDTVAKKGNIFREIDGVVIHFAGDKALCGHFDEKIKKVMKLFDAGISLPTKLTIQKDVYKEKLVELTIRPGDSLWGLFGNNWTKVYNSPVNVDFKEEFPDPDFIDIDAVIYAPSVFIADGTHPLCKTVAVAGEFILDLFDPEQHLVGAEIGCCWATTSEVLLSSFPHLRLYMVDSWANYPNYRVMDYESYYRAAMNRTDFAKDRRIVLRGLSEEMASHCVEPLDFVFIDANHSYDFVKQDLELWYPKVKEGGLVSGHDWQMNGVVQAVQEFAGKIGKDIEITKSTYPFDTRSWYFWK